MQFGDFEVFVLGEGQYIVGEDKVFVPHHQGDPLPKGTLFVALNPFLIKTRHENILLDCGLGEEAQGRSITFLLDNLAQYDVNREEVDKVLLSHLHFDHTGGAIFRLGDELVPTFPNATYYAQRGEASASFKGRSESFKTELIATLEAHGQLTWLDGDGEIEDPNMDCRIEYRITGGHTAFHQAFLLHDTKDIDHSKTILFGGDVLPQPSQVNRRFLAKYDFAPDVSQAQRVILAKEAYEKEYLVLFYHSTQEPAAFLTHYDERTGYKMDLLQL